jgi:hypothetical protein
MNSRGPRGPGASASRVDQATGATTRASALEAFALARQVATGSVDADEAERLGAALARRAEAALAKARDEGRLEEAQRRLHEAWLEIGYARSGGRAPSSLRLAAATRPDAT